MRALNGSLGRKANAPQARTNPGQSGAGRRWAACAPVALLLALATSLGHAAEVRVPLTIDYLTLGEAIRHQLYTAPGDRAALWNGPDECQFLYAENPSFSRAGELADHFVIAGRDSWRCRPIIESNADSAGNAPDQRVAPYSLVVDRTARGLRG